MSGELADIVLVVGRLLLGGIFVFGGIEHYFVAKPVLAIMARRGVPMPLFVLIVGSVFEAVLGLMLMLGLYVAWASLGLVVFTVAATIMFLNFWDMDGAERVAAQNNATVNVGVIGGLLVLASEALR
jgi:putative oxidoreductase